MPSVNLHEGEASKRHPRQPLDRTPAELNEFMLAHVGQMTVGEDAEGGVGLSECSLHQKNSMCDSVQAILGIKRIQTRPRPSR